VLRHNQRIIVLLSAFCLLLCPILVQAATLPTALGWTDVSNTQLQGVCPPVGDNQPPATASYDFPSHCSALVRAWNSGIGDTKRNRLILWGGGHNDYYGNEVYAFDLTTLQLTRLNHPSPTAPLNNQSCGPETLSDQTPNSRHTYSGLTYIASADKMFTVGGGLAAQVGCLGNSTWVLDMATLQWTSMEPHNGDNVRHDAGIISAYDPNSQLVYVMDQQNFYSYNYNTNTYKILNGNVGISLYMNAVVDPKRKLFFAFGAGGIQKISIAPGSTYAKTNPTGTGCSAISGASAPGLAYDIALDKIVGWPNSGNTVYLYDPDNDSCATQTYSTNAPPDSSGVSGGTMGRFQYFPTPGVYALVNDWNIDAHILRLTTGGTPPPPPPPCDVNGDGQVNVADVQKEVNMDLQVIPCTNLSGQCTVIQVQRVVNAALGGACIAP
jgi:hypothetical protein